MPAAAWARSGWPSDGEIGRPVAVERLRKERQDEHERFLVEAQITGQLEHPGIVPVHDVGKDKQGQPFYVMKFVHGRTLREAIDDYHSDNAASKPEREVAAAPPACKSSSSSARRSPTPTAAGSSIAI